MATSTFDKEIILSDEAAERLSYALRRGAKRELPNFTEIEKRENEEWQFFLKNSPNFGDCKPNILLRNLRAVRRGNPS